MYKTVEYWVLINDKVARRFLPINNKSSAKEVLHRDFIAIQYCCGELFSSRLISSNIIFMFIT